MDKATVFGLALGFTLVIGSIMLGSGLGAFIDIPSLLIVVGGTIASTFTAEKMSTVLAAMKVMKKAFREPAGDAVATIQRIIELSTIARREGVLALENETVDDVFLAKGIRMAVDGLPDEEIRATLSAEMISMKARHIRGQNLFKFMAATAPSMGMIGTLIGLVQMLQSLDDPAAIGPSMAVALLTTMYGAILAFMIFGPIAEKLDRYGKEESLNMSVVIEGVESIVKGQNAMIIKDKLEARIAPAERVVDQAA